MLYAYVTYDLKFIFRIILTLVLLYTLQIVISMSMAQLWMTIINYKYYLFKDNYYSFHNQLLGSFLFTFKRYIIISQFIYHCLLILMVYNLLWHKVDIELDKNQRFWYDMFVMSTK